MTELMQASKQHASRPADERFCNLHELHLAAQYMRDNSTRRVMANRQLTAIPSTTDPFDIACQFKTPKGEGLGNFTHWSFGQASALASAPAEYLRSLPGALAADNLNWGLHHARKVEDVSVNLFAPRNGDGQRDITVRSINGPNYGVVWDAEVTGELVSHFGDGVHGTFRIPGHFGGNYDGSKESTTLYRSDRDMFVFLADEERRIDIPNRRNGQTGTLARGFWLRNSEVGASKLVLAAFLFDYMCCNHIIWDVGQFKEISIKHTSGAPFRWNEEIRPILKQFAEGPMTDIETAITNARAAKVQGDVETFIATRFGTSSIVPKIELAFMADEGMGKPMETVWDVVTGATAYARQLEHVDARVKVERVAGQLLAQTLH